MNNTCSQAIFLFELVILFVVYICLILIKFVMPALLKVLEYLCDGVIWKLKEVNSKWFGMCIYGSLGLLEFSYFFLMNMTLSVNTDITY